MQTNTEDKQSKLNQLRTKLSKLQPVRLVSTVISFIFSLFLLFEVQHTHSIWMQLIFILTIFIIILLIAYIKLAYFPARKIFTAIIEFTEPFKIYISMLFIFMPSVFYVLTASSPNHLPSINVDIITASESWVVFH